MKNGSSMIVGVENLSMVFSVFHDGALARARLENDALVFDVEISYLAERVKPGSDVFTVRLVQPRHLIFAPWLNDPSAEPEVMDGLEVLVHDRLEVLRAEVEGELVKVECNAPRTGKRYCGGVLSFSAAGLEVFDMSGNSWTVEQLISLAQGYWDEWEQKNKH